MQQGRQNKYLTAQLEKHDNAIITFKMDRGVYVAGSNVT